MHFVLVHGAWHGAWCWEHLEAELHTRSHTATAVDLPGHGEDPTPLAEVTLDAYVDRVVRWIRELDRPVELVGHSMAGAVITQVAEEIPNHLAGLVYLCAFLPRSGEVLSELSQEDRESALHGSLESGPERDTLVVASGAAREIFYHDCRSEIADAAIERLVPQAMAPLGEAVSTSEERFGSVSRSYILCTEDRAITAAMQRKMIARLPCSPLVELAMGHSPFYANPAALADALELIAASRQ